MTTDEPAVWQLPEALLVHLLRRAAAGDDVDLLMLELEANAEHPDDEEQDQ